MKVRQAEADPVAVPARAKQAGEVQGRWSWVEPSVWTERMLTALEVGVKGGKWYSGRLRSWSRSREVGLNTSSTATGRSLRSWTSGPGCGCVASCATVTSAK